MVITANHIDDLKLAKSLLERLSLTDKITHLLGDSVRRTSALLPARLSETIGEVTRRSLYRALNVAVKTLADKPHTESSDRFHKILVAVNGAASGAIGLPALLIELPLSTTIMLRSIADVARSEGERIQTLDARLACFEVFALGRRSGTDGAAETGYFAVRAALARAVSEAAKYIAERGLAEEGAPVLVRLIGLVATRFGLVVSEKIAAQAVPVIGAAGGALANTIFIDHFQETARGHFIVRRLERVYGSDAVRSLYEEV